jgi:hypothetical protein
MKHSAKFIGPASNSAETLVNEERTVGAALRGRPWLGKGVQEAGAVAFQRQDQSHGRPRRAAPTKNTRERLYSKLGLETA